MQTKFGASETLAGKGCKKTRGKRENEKTLPKVFPMQWLCCARAAGGDFLPGLGDRGGL